MSVMVGTPGAAMAVADADPDANPDADADGAVYAVLCVALFIPSPLPAPPSNLAHMYSHSSCCLLYFVRFVFSVHGTRANSK